MYVAQLRGLKVFSKIFFRDNKTVKIISVTPSQYEKETSYNDEDFRKKNIWLNLRENGVVENRPKIKIEKLFE